MGQCILLSLLCLFLALLPSLALSPRASGEDSGAAGVVGEIVLPAENTAAEPLSPAEDCADGAPVVLASPLTPDESTVFTMLDKDGTLRSVTMAEYLPGVLAGEMPASFHLEALKAQAVAARTYILCRMAEGCPAHPEAAVCTSPGCCQAWCNDAELHEKWGGDYDYYLSRLSEAARATDGVCLLWEGEPILACFHSSSAGATESSAAVWNGALPYLVSVASPETAEDVPNFISTLEVSAEDFRRSIWSSRPGADLSGDPLGWVGTSRADESGRVAAMVIGGLEISGNELRELFALRSTAFTLEWTGQGFLFTVTGYGHGVGLSQYGANVMAGDGVLWEDILLHYYPGAQLHLMDTT